MTKEFARRFVISRSVKIAASHRYLIRTSAKREAPGFATRLIEGEQEMQKTILTIAGSALIVLSTVQLAAAAEHQGKTHHRSAAAVQYRQSNAYVTPTYVAVQPEWPGYGYGYGYSGGYSAPAGR